MSELQRLGHDWIVAKRACEAAWDEQVSIEKRLKLAMAKEGVPFVKVDGLILGFRPPCMDPHIEVLSAEPLKP